MLTLRDVDVSIQASEILRRVSLEVGDREVVCLVGRNGAGKTTTLRAIMGYLRPRAGTIEFLGRNLAGLPTHQIANLGIGYAPEGSAIFPDLTERQHHPTHPHPWFIADAITEDGVHGSCASCPLIRGRGGSMHRDGASTPRPSGTGSTSAHTAVR